MIILALASLLIAFVSGLLLTFFLGPSLKNSAAGLALGFCAGGGLGLGLTSCLYFIALLTGLTEYIPAIDLGVCLLLGALCFTRFKGSSAPTLLHPPELGKRSRLHLLFAGILSIELIAWAVTFVIAYFKEPHGRWDAWLIWNMHARFLFRGGDHWRDAFASGLDWSHWDYPLLLPLSIVRGWQYMGSETPLLPAIMGFCFTLLTIGLLLTTLTLLRGRVQGYLAAMVLLGTPFLITMGAAQFADVPLAFFILMTLGMLTLQARAEEGSVGMLLLAGLAAGMAAWTKNEGILFLLVAALSLFAATVRTGSWRKACRRTAGFLAGAMPILLIVLTFKLLLAPTGDLAAGVSWAALTEKLFDWSRYAQIARAFLLMGMSFTQGLVDVRVGMQFNPGAINILLLIAYLLFVGIRIDRPDRTGLLTVGVVLCLMLAGYFLVYVLTPLDLTYHLITSLNRLFLQLWPSVILLTFMIARAPEETSPGRATGPTPQVKLRPTKGRTQQRNQEVG